MMNLGTLIPYLKKIQRYRLHFNSYFLILLIFFESLKIVLISTFEILIMSAILTTLGFVKKRYFKIKVMTP